MEVPITILQRCKARFPVPTSTCNDDCPAGWYYQCWGKKKPKPEVKGGQ